MKLYQKKSLYMFEYIFVLYHNENQCDIMIRKKDMTLGHVL